MARGKNSPALFEVIRNAQQKQKEQLERQRQQQIAADLNAVSPAAALLRSPMYWFKGKLAHEAAIDQTLGQSTAAPAVEARPAPARSVERPVERRQADLPVMREVPAARPAAQVVPAAVVTPPPVATAPACVSPAADAARQVREDIAAQEAPAAEPLFGGSDYSNADYSNAYDTDADASPAYINLRFNTTTAIIAGFAIVVAFTVAYVIGTAGRHEKATVAKNVVRPSVLDVRPDAPAPVPTANPVTPADDDSRASLITSADLALDTLGKPIPVPTNVKRVIGYQYLVLMSFPTEEPAKEMVKFLAQNGVPATAEKALPGYATSWTSVVTTRGFDHVRNNPAFDAYRSALADLKQKYRPNSKFSKTFNIDVYAWRTAR